MSYAGNGAPPVVLDDQILDSLSPSEESRGALAALAWRVGSEAAGPAAAEVDRDARFPHEALAGLREAKLLSALIPAELGGAGASLAEVAGAVRALAFHCTSSALMLAMHTNEIGQFVRFGHTDGLRELLRDIARDQLLVANANSEVGLGGDATKSICAVETTEAGASLSKHALACSYGEYADVIDATARRHPGAESGDQVLIALRRDDIRLEATSEWDTMGLRGTCSGSLQIEATVDPALIFPVRFADISANGTLQAWMILICSVWVGLAEAAAARAHAHVRKAARRTIGTRPPSALRLAELAADLAQARGLLAANLLNYTRVADTPAVSGPDMIMAARTLKVVTSQLALQIASQALAICGIAGYQRNSATTLDRLIRDAHGSVLMVSNDRYLDANAELLTVRKQL